MDIIDKISADLKLDNNYLHHVVGNADYYYRDYYIPKKRGGKRHIAQPSPELKTLQYWVLRNILEKLPVSKAACAYKKGDSIKKHAQIHKQSKHILHVDIHDFFYSIKTSHLDNILRKNAIIFNTLGIQIEPSIQFINKICFRRDKLCIGAVSSPVISNIIMNSFDNEILAFCEEKKFLYTRYADDMYISSSSFLDASIVSLLDEKLKKMNLIINREKTGFYSPKYRRQITGIIITNDSRISLGTEYRKRIKQMIYNKLVNGLGNPDVIMGYLSLLKDIEPLTYNNLIIKYSKYCKGDIIKKLRELTPIDQSAVLEKNIQD